MAFFFFFGIAGATCALCLVRVIVSGVSLQVFALLLLKVVNVYSAFCVQVRLLNLFITLL